MFCAQDHRLRIQKMPGVVSQLKKMFPACHPERRATAHEVAGAQVEGPREFLLYHADAGSSLKLCLASVFAEGKKHPENVWSKLPDAAWEKDTFSGCFDAPSLATLLRACSA